MPVGLSHPVDERCRQIEGQADQRSFVNTDRDIQIPGRDRQLQRDL